jgi:nucleoside-diphosphate-sugar epimerase
MVRYLRDSGATVFVAPRGHLAPSQHLGHVIYCIGLTADWRQRRYDAVRAHVAYLLSIIEQERFDSFLYLSSTRIYKRTHSTDEGTSFLVSPSDPDDLFDISKIMGESVCLGGAPTTRVARLSNVYGDDYCSDNFLSSVIRDALTGSVTLRTSLHSAKDYISVDEVVGLLAKIAVRGRHQIYNVATGINTTHEEAMSEVRRLTGCELHVSEGAPDGSFPGIATNRVQEEFGFSGARVVDSLDRLVQDFRNHRDMWERR